MTARRVIGWDTETHLIQRGKGVPRVVCATFAGGPDTVAVLDMLGMYLPGGDVWIHRSDTEWSILAGRAAIGTILFLCLDVLGTDGLLVAHNGGFDWNILFEYDPELRATFVELLEAGNLSDTYIRAQLIGIARDTFEYDSQLMAVPTFSLAELVKKYLGFDISEDKKDPLAWRLRYCELDGIPVRAWPSAAVSYALSDAVYARRVWQCQTRYANPPEGVMVDDQGMVTNEVEQLAASVVLTGMGFLGVMRDPDEVARFAVEVEAEAARSEVLAQNLGILTVNKCPACFGTGWVGAPPTLVPCSCGGDPAYMPPRCRVPYGKPTTNTKRLKAWVQWAYGNEPPMTKPDNPEATPQVSTAEDTLLGSGQPKLIEYAKSLGAKKLVSTYLPILREGLDAGDPLTSSPQVLVRSGRTSWRGPNMQNPPRD